jgi:Fe(3+) dicitrate transport protein
LRRDFVAANRTCEWLAKAETAGMLRVTMGSCLALVLAAPGLAADAGVDEALVGGDAPAPPVAEIIVIGDLSRLQDISGSAAVVTEEDMRRSRVFTVNDVLRMVPGVFPRDEEGMGVRPNIGIRGLNPTRSTKVLLLEDGVPLGFAPYGDNAAYYHPPIERFSAVEVLKGAAQVRFGPQTIGGVINYITPKAPETLGGRLTASGGNLGTVNLDGMVGGPLLGGGVLLHVNHKQSEGNRENQRLRVTDAFLKGDWELGANQALTVKLSLFDEGSDVTYSGLRRDEFEDSPRANPFVNDRFDTRRYSASLSHRWNLSDAVTLRTTGYFHRFERDWWRQSSNSGQRPNDASDPACGGMANLSSSCGNEGRLRAYNTWGVESRLELAHAVDGETELGIRFHEERQARRQWNGDTPVSRTPGTGINAGVRENNERDASAVAAFVQSRLVFGPLALIPGVRGEFIRYERRNLPVDVIVGGRPTGAQTAASSANTRLDALVPGLGATLDIAPELTLYGGVHRGFAPPRVEDIITTAGGSVDIDAELSWNWEAGIRGRLLPGLRGDATLFLMNFENQIVPQSVAGGVGATLTSAGRTLHRGGELSLNFSSREAGLTSGATEIYTRTALTWVPTARYSSTRIATVPCEGAAAGTLIATGRGPRACGQPLDVIGNRLPYSPEWLVSAAIGVEHEGAQAQVELVGQSSMFADETSTIPVTADGQRGEIPGWAMVNLSLAYGPPGGRWEVFASARNLFDRLIIVDRSRGVLPGAPRMVLAGVTLRY